MVVCLVGGGRILPVPCCAQGLAQKLNFVAPAEVVTHLMPSQESELPCLGLLNGFMSCCLGLPNALERIGFCFPLLVHGLSQSLIDRAVAPLHGFSDLVVVGHHLLRGMQVMK